MNNKTSSPAMATMASEILRSSSASGIQKILAASVLSQADPQKQTGSDMERIASNVLRSEKYSDTTHSLAASVLSQCNKER